MNIETIIDAISAVLIVGGSAFYLIGAIGLVRMPDVFTRMHATSVSETLGAGLLIGGLILQSGISLVSAKLAVIMALFIYTGPIATHALARAAMYAGLKPELAEDRLTHTLPVVGNEKVVAKSPTAAPKKGARRKVKTVKARAAAASSKGRQPSKR